MFTREHYIALAAVISQSRLDCKGNDDQEMAIDSLAINLADALHEDNPHFNVIQFLCATQMPEDLAASVQADLAQELAAKLARVSLDERLSSEHTCDTDCECWDDPELTTAIQLAVASGMPVMIPGITLADLLRS